MMQTNYLCYILTALFLLSGCSSRPEIRVVEETWPGGKEKTIKYYKERGEKKILLREETYYLNGQKEQEGSYKNGERTGVWKYWYDSGLLWSEGEFLNGKSHGYRKVYHPNGKLYYEGTYKDDKPIGTWKFFDKEGRFVQEKVFE
jgi:antitoxin component YwqK of YwqJK toxin-antitoxin module